MKTLYVAAILFTGTLSFAKPALMSATNTGNIYTCQAASDIYEAYRLNLASVEKIKFGIASTSEPMLKRQLGELLSLAQKGLNDSIAQVKVYDDQLIILATVNMDAYKLIPALRLSGQPTEGRVTISEAFAVGSNVTIPARQLDIRFYGAKACNAIAKANGDVFKATTQLVEKLLAD